MDIDMGGNIVKPLKIDSKMYQIDTCNASKKAMELFSLGMSACFAVEVQDGIVIATAPIGWELRRKRWSEVLEWATTGGVKITEVETK